MTDIYFDNRQLMIYKSSCYFKSNLLIAFNDWFLTRCKTCPTRKKCVINPLKILSIIIIVTMNLVEPTWNQNLDLRRCTVNR